MHSAYRGGLSHKPGSLLRSPGQINAVNFSIIELRQINVNDHDKYDGQEKK